VIQALDIDGNVIDVPAPPRAVAAGGGTPLTDDLDLLKNIEQLQFADRTFAIGDPSAIVNWNGVRPGENALPGNNVVIANLSTTDVDNTPVTWSRIGGTAPVTVSTGGVVTTTAALAGNQVYTLTVRATETGNPTAFVDKVISIRTGTGGDNTIIGSGLTDVIYGLAGDDTLNGFGNSDTLFGQAGDDILNGGVGNDGLTGGTGDDEVNGGAGADTIRYVIGDGIDTVDGGTGTDTLSITAGGGEQVLDVLYDGTSLTEFGSIGLDDVRGTVTGVESVTANLGGGIDSLDYAGSTGNLTVDLGAGTASGFTSIAGIEEVAGGAGDDTLTGDGLGNIIWGEGGNDTINGGGGADDLAGGIGSDIIDTGAVNDNEDDFIQYFAANEFGDTIINFDATGGAGEDVVVFLEALNTAYDDGNNNDNFLFVTGNAGGGTTAATVGQGNGDAEALLLLNGVAAGNLSNLGLVSAAINTEFVIGGTNNGEDALLVVDASGSNNFGVYQWIQAGGGETSAAELTLIGVFTANGTVATANFDFF
jgi:RTX calcium-binding nonapeptide repeat (4 copies)